MPDKAEPTHEEKVAAALADGRAKGLPHDWTVRFNTQNRRKWIAPSGKLYDSIPKALAQIRKERAAAGGGDGSGGDGDGGGGGAVSAAAYAAALGLDSSAAAEGSKKKSKKKKRPASSQSKSSSKQTSRKKARSKSPQPPGQPKYPVTPKIHEDIIRPEPESDPETALDVKKSGSVGHGKASVPAARSGKAVTVHWDPNSPEGKRVGFSIRIFDQDDEEWREGRVLRYDPGSCKHKIQYADNDECRWLRLKHEIIQCGGDFVWALVKGFAWWPAQVLICEPATETTRKEGYVYVKFFGAEQVAMVKNSPDNIRPFRNGEIDSVIAKNKKKRNPKAIKEAKLEQEKTLEVRNEAIRFYARKAFDFANNDAGNFLGKRIQFYNSFINYPAGDTVIGTVKQYSSTQKKWLILYDTSTLVKHKIDPACWFNFVQKECHYKIVDKAKGPKKDPSDDELAPYMFGSTIGDGRNGPRDEPIKKSCSSCSQPLVGSLTELTCSRCSHTFHSACCDPPLSLKAVENILNMEEPWICSKCTPCAGCNDFDIVFGTKRYPAPPTLFTKDGGSSIQLCSRCIPLYESDQYCPNCCHCWDDFKYQKVQRVLRWQRKLKEDANEENTKNQAKKRKRGGEEGEDDPMGDDEEDAHLDDVAAVCHVDNEETVAYGMVADPSWYHPDSSVWGFNEGSMLICDSCNLWVHAGCAGLTKEEYEKTNRGEHPIYSKEFLCRKCCVVRCQSLIAALNKEDQLGLFAVPVTEQMAPTYHDVIKNPIDLQTMLQRANKGEYHNYAWIRELFELMVTNALVFNRPNSAFWKEAKRYHEACMSKVFSEIGMGKAAPAGKHADALREAFEKAKRWREAEKERVQKDDTAEKKDLVAGAEVAAVKLGPLVTPEDVPSCVPFVNVRLKAVDAFFSSWMDCCFCCGSSGASDTMLFCVDCGEAYHSFCANAPIYSMSASAAASWRCPNCKVCEITGDVPEDETMLLFCEMCDRACTLTELDPPLKQVPRGLFICGLCVDCKSCNNEPKRSVKFWSQDPETCFRCGGCEPAMDKKAKAMKCMMCSKYWRSEDKDIVSCKTCNRGVHSSCDRNARRALESFSSLSTFECSECGQKTANRTQASSLQLHLRNQSRNMLLQGCALLPNPDARAPTSDLHIKLADEAEWAVRKMWRNEYRSLIKDAERLLGIASKKFGKGLEGLFVASEQNNSDIPSWLINRARRWVRYEYHRKSKTSESVPGKETSIRVLVLQAQMAAAFLAMSLRCVPSFAVKCPERMKFLLVPPHPVSGSTILSPDPLKSTGQEIISANELTIKQYGSIINVASLRRESIDDTDEGVGNRKEDGPISPPSAQEGRTMEIEEADDTNCHPASALRGWDVDEHHHVPGRAAWRDPRTCAFCHTCGDDDAGLGDTNNTSDTVQERQSAIALTGAGGSPSNPNADVTKGSPSEKQQPSAESQDELGQDDESPEKALTKVSAGRLIPMPGGAWAHVSCALWSSEVYESPKDGLVYALEKARSRGAKLKCFGCGRPGATVGCQRANCSYNYHFACAFACGAVFTAKQHILCTKHKSSVKGDLEPNVCVEHMRPFNLAPDGKSAVSSDSNLCYRLGSLVVHSLGRIEQDIDGFHSEQYITPPGYTATRIFWSYQAPKRRTVYVIKVNKEGTRPVFTIVAADASDTPITCKSMFDAYATLIDRVRQRNAFSLGSNFSHLPRIRTKEDKVYGLNAPQFFGFGLEQVRKSLETSPGIAAVAAPLSAESPAYKFCFAHPKKEEIKNLMRKRAAMAAEKALENPSGSARTEGMTAVDKSGGSGRITRALVRRADEEVQGGGRTSSGKGGRDLNDAKVETAIQAKYREMKSVPLEDRLVAKRSHIHGWGLFTKKDIRKNQMIIEYMGELLRFPVADRREKEYEQSGVGSCYMFRLDLERIVDATMVGCMARFMNHSCQNNAYAKVITVNTEAGMGQEKKIVVFANRDIKAESEITYDYKFPVEDGSLKCTCGAPNCIGRMN
eukprot:CAMPEP_0178547080 /NCGR_PEP_ID=MMETSP0697-20121206/4490_1 /TAXON_ID=265572 /ORGANISM="Extubocellulus spinifer, Strain CCMP396" /LENGTH=1996 /DNA_ID=CAMNT_0020179701 /DNA_START=128 /DNA_END=6118 /DNA_ORIENTATION=-